MKLKVKKYKEINSGKPLALIKLRHSFASEWLRSGGILYCYELSLVIIRLKQRHFILICGMKMLGKLLSEWKSKRIEKLIPLAFLTPGYSFGVYVFKGQAYAQVLGCLGYLVLFGAST